MPPIIVTQDEDEVEHEEAEHEQQAEHDQPGPEQPLVQVEVGRVVAERPRPDVVQDDEGDEQDERRDPGRPEEVREVVAGEREEEVLPGRQRHGQTP